MQINADKAIKQNKNWPLFQFISIQLACIYLQGFVMLICPRLANLARKHQNTSVLITQRSTNRISEIKGRQFAFTVRHKNIISSLKISLLDLRHQRSVVEIALWSQTGGNKNRAQEFREQVSVLPSDTNWFCCQRRGDG